MFADVIAHRGGGALVAPDNALSAFRKARLAGIKHIECDVRLTSDGFPVCLHDDTLDAITTGTGAVTSVTLAQFKALTLDCASFLGYGYINEQPCSFEDFILELHGSASVVMWPEAKVTGATLAMIALLAKYNVPRERVVFTSSIAAECAVAAAHGYRNALAVADASATDFKALKTDNVTIVVANTWTPASVAAAHFQGLQTASYNSNLRVDYLKEKSKGIDFIYSDDPCWLTDVPLGLKGSPFNVGQYFAGMSFAVARGVFMGGGKFGYTDATLSGYAGTAMGWSCPLKSAADADAFTITMTACITAVNGADSTRHLDFFVCAATDAMFSDAGVSGIVDGYNILMRQNGTIQIYKAAAGAAGVLLAQTTGSSFTLNQEYTIAIVVTKLSVKLTVVEVARSVEAFDTAFRGGYWHFGRNGAAGYIKNVIIA